MKKQTSLRTEFICPNENISFPIGTTVREGITSDQVHFNDTSDQVKDRLQEGSMVVIEQGANRKENPLVSDTFP